MKVKAITQRSCRVVRNRRKSRNEFLDPKHTWWLSKTCFPHSWSDDVNFFFGVFFPSVVVGSLQEKEVAMGFKVNCWLAFLITSGYLSDNFTVKALFVNLSWFTLIYMNFKIWRFTSMFPGGGLGSVVRSVFSSPANFHQELSLLFSRYGDKFITWVGLERFIVVSDPSDVKVNCGL